MSIMTFAPIAQRCGLIAPASEFTRALFMNGEAWWHIDDPSIVTPEPWVEIFQLTRISSVIYIPRALAKSDRLDVHHARAAFGACRLVSIRRLTLLWGTAPISPQGTDAKVLEWAAMAAVGYQRTAVIRVAQTM
jgi:hypothetical protein